MARRREESLFTRVRSRNIAPHFLVIRQAICSPLPPSLRRSLLSPSEKCPSSFVGGRRNLPEGEKISSRSPEAECDRIPHPRSCTPWHSPQSHFFRSGSDGAVRPPAALGTPAETDEVSEGHVKETRAAGAAAAALAVAKQGARIDERTGRRKAFVRGRCAHPECQKFPCFADDTAGTKRFCKEHKAPGMVNFVNRRCAHSDCAKRPTFGDPNARRADFCVEHKLPGMSCVEPRRVRNRKACGSTGGDDSRAAASVFRDGSAGVKRRRSASSPSRPSNRNRKAGKRSAQMELFVNFKFELQSEGV